MPILQLPDELLVYIANMSIANEGNRLNVPSTLASICTRLRSLYIATPELWTRINAVWGERAIRLFATRSESRALQISVENTRNDADKTALEYLPRADVLLIALSSRPTQSFDDSDEPEANNDYEDDETRMDLANQAIDSLMVELASTAAPRLRTLEISDESDANWYFGAHALHPASTTGLTSLMLRGAFIDDVPRLPALRCLHLYGCLLQSGALYQCLLQTPVLEELLTRDFGTNIAFWHESYDDTLAELQLPFLRHVFLQGPTTALAAFVGALPNPRWTFVVHTEPDRAVHAIYLEGVLACMKLFWGQRADASRPFPSGTLQRVPSVLSKGRLDSFVTFETLPSTSDPTPNVFAMHFRAKLLRNEVVPFEGEVRTLHLDYEAYSTLHKDASMLGTQGRPSDLRQLRTIEDLVVKNVRSSVDVTRSLEDWIESRHKGGAPFRVLEFRNCDKGAADEMVERLKSAGVAPRIAWG
jgi:hypothetical protein